MKRFFFCFALLAHCCLYATPYFSEYHENGFIIIFQGDVSEEDIARIKFLEREYVEEMLSSIQMDSRIPDQLEKLGVMIKVIKDDPGTLPEGYLIVPQQENRMRR